ncbi:MAG: S1 RNA-binding domain-containing protein [Anaerolineales bacterium]|uniref:30S ribosomal protein S1 n=1 Tax=Candidatus Villigracilis vicinus TaxID=3140679 RepID=UPI0031354F2A|nr:S1 RNA-binding domain-containing protein [Anaerolineales bacterium]MBK7449275.1 S1 RNA-binding domain-containing protein [Anaerolineales bacterium]MBK9779056.1 S1 RNA-binding domain-containing protein [Anaerolineales bacterium]
MADGKERNESTVPAMDDGWWESVLAEESRHPAHTQPRVQPSKSEVQPGAGKEAHTEQQPAVNWSQIKDLYMKDRIIDLTVTGHNRGGLLVEGDGLFGFVPFSHLIDLAGKENLDRNQDLEPYLGRSLHLKVIECVPEDGRVVFSERAAQTEPGKRAELFHSLHAGQNAHGTVTNVTDFGVFVDLGGVEGLIHISELSWGRVTHPSQFVKLGNAIDVQVLDLAPERCRVALSLKRLLPNPWTNAATEFPIGSIHAATITSVLSYGVFARLDKYGVEGLVHASEIPHEEGVLLKEFLSDGQSIQVRVLHLDPAHHRLGFSMRLE